MTKNTQRRKSSLRTLKNLLTFLKSKIRKTNILRLTKYIFWIIMGLDVLATLIILTLNSTNILSPPTNSTLVPSLIYNNSLSYIFGVIGFLIAIIIFLIQHINSKFHSEETEMVPSILKYFVITLVMLFLFIGFNFVVLYCDLDYPFTLMSLLYSFSLILLIAVVSIFAYYGTKPTFIFDSISKDVLKFISENKEFDKSPIDNSDIKYTDDFVELLIKKTSFFVKNVIYAIKKDQEMSLLISLEKIKEIIITYLEVSKHIHSHEDPFLYEMNDQYNFIIEESLQCYNPKILEDVAAIAGEISMSIYKNRKVSIGTNNNLYAWLSTIRELFYKSLRKERTNVSTISLNKLKAVSLMLIEDNDPENFYMFNVFLETISESLALVDSNKTAILLQRALFAFQEQFLKILELTKSGNLVWDPNSIDVLFNKINEIIDKVKENYSKLSSRQIVFASFFGINSLVYRISRLNLNEIQNDQIKKLIAWYIIYYIDFCGNIWCNKIDKNENNSYLAFSELLYLVNRRLNLRDTEITKSNTYLMRYFIMHIERRYSKALETEDRSIFYEVRRYSMDFFALFIYLLHDNNDLIRELMEKYLKIYQTKKMSLKFKDETIQISLYNELKLYSCWINIFPNLVRINETIIQTLKDDFIEPEESGRITHTPLFEKYGYPENRYSSYQEMWFLSPSRIWDFNFQNEITALLNGRNGEHYISFHEMLKKT